MATVAATNKDSTKTLIQEPADPNSVEASDVSTSPNAPPQPKESGAEDREPAGDPAAGNNNGSGNDTQKKIKRAERFGMPVHLSEQEKRDSRAERFGTRAGSQLADVTKKSEDNKRKARAERFGLEQSVPAAEEDKKKARLARFAPASKTDLVEEDKKKARALRFSETSNSLPQAGNGIEPKAAITGKAGGGA